MFEFVEEALDFIALSVKPVAEGRRAETIGHGAYIRPSPALGEAFAKGVGIIGPVRQQNVSRPHGIEHVLGAAPVMGLAFGEFQGDRQAGGIDEGVDLRRQAAP